MVGRAPDESQLPVGKDFFRLGRSGVLRRGAPPSIAPSAITGSDPQDNVTDLAASQVEPFRGQLKLTDRKEPQSGSIYQPWVGLLLAADQPTDHVTKRTTLNGLGKPSPHSPQQVRRQPLQGRDGKGDTNRG